MFSKIYRFTPPTCTLEIKGKKSPLSRWQNRDLLDRVQFKLSFDDPRLPSDRQIIIEGDQQDLEQLKMVVNDYLENLLHASFTHKERVNQDFNTTKNNPYLRSTGLVSQELFLGTLKGDRDRDKIELSTTQLFDLVTALQAYDTKISALSQLNQRRQKPSILIWGGVAAGLILAVGIAKVLLPTSSVQNIAESAKPESSTSIRELDRVVPPSAPQRAKKTLQPKPNNTLSSTKRLPPPPAVDTPKPKPNIPDPADYPLSKVARNSGFDSPTKQTESVIVIPPNTKPAASNFKEPKNNTKIIPEVNQKNEIQKDFAELSNDSIINSDNSVETVIKPAKKLSQIEQVQAYFSSRWQPPADLKQSLEYRLKLNADGSIKKVIPIGKAAKMYLTQTNIPVQREKFIDPVTQSQSTKIRLLLNPDGGVKVFTE